MSRRVALYARVSTKGQTLENQLAELRVVCERNNWDVVQVFTDFGISGAKGRSQRSELDAFAKGRRATRV
jgi:DNA invertase Pin-like site-specific DNA recombinase